MSGDSAVSTKPINHKYADTPRELAQWIWCRFVGLFEKLETAKGELCVFIVSRSERQEIHSSIRNASEASSGEVGSHAR